ncbi:MAG TPA: hypothetical protein VIH72_00195 [Candidatus Acidoferrales bacterium]|jgi:hypothetical protein
MELLLNLAWVVISLVAIFLLRGDWRKRKSPPLREWIALATFLFVLFPVISLTDDLHPEIALAEAATGKKHFQLLRAHGPASPPQSSHAPATHAVIFRNQSCPAPELRFAGIFELNVSTAISAPTKVTSGRSPPSILL